MNFENALVLLKNKHAVTRKKLMLADITIHMQAPDSNSKMTGRYLYTDSFLAVASSNPTCERVPWLPSFEDLFAEDWEIA